MKGPARLLRVYYAHNHNCVQSCHLDSCSTVGTNVNPFLSHPPPNVLSDSSQWLPLEKRLSSAIWRGVRAGLKSRPFEEPTGVTSMFFFCPSLSFLSGPNASRQALYPLTLAGPIPWARDVGNHEKAWDDHNWGSSD